jgi:1-acyl-sn-glycerol-3-phosphate acyltransferase
MAPIVIEKQREDPINLLPYNAFKWLIIMPTLFTYFRGRRYGLEHVPMRGPLVVVSNHASDFDPPILASCVGRPLAFMAKEELFRVPVLGSAIRVYGAYPVKRGSPDRSALKASLESMQRGWAVGIFLEGSRTPDARIHNPKLGAALIAAKTGASLLPVSLWGTQNIIQKPSPIPRPVPVTIRIGELVPPPQSTDRSELEAVTNRCTQMIHEMHDLGR